MMDRMLQMMAVGLIVGLILAGFIDEILRGSTAILNTLLDLLAAPVDHSVEATAL